MNIYCIERFKIVFEKLISNSTYKQLETTIINYFFCKSVKEIYSGVRLNNSAETPYIKKRIGGRGGFRCYFLVLIKDDALYLMFVHPKSGSKGSTNITNESKALLYKEVLECIKNQNLFQLTLNDTNSKIIFEKLTQV